MAKKKNKKAENLPAGMSRRQAKLAARAAEREALQRDPRPYAAFSYEADLVALQEFVPSATAKVAVKGLDREVYICTVLPGGVAALVREDGVAFAALQTRLHSNNPHRDLAFALQWLSTAQPQQELSAGSADGSQPELTELIDASAEFEITEYSDFNWWFPQGAQVNPQFEQAIKTANDSVVPTHQVSADVNGVVWWSDFGDKAFIRWVRTDDEDALMRALARIAARGELKLGDETKFAGVFRTHGIAVPVWDLSPQREYTSYEADLVTLDGLIAAELGNDAQLSADERRQLENIKSRQVTIR